MHNSSARSPGSAPLRNRPRREGRAAALLAALLLVGARTAAASPDASAGVLLRQARYAVAARDLETARRALVELREREPGSARGLEGALLLADVELAAGNAGEARRALQDAQPHFPSGDAAIQISLGLGLLDLATQGGSRAAADEFARARALAATASTDALARLGSAWATLVSLPGTEPPADLAALLRRAPDRALQIAAGLTLARAEAAVGRHAQARRALKKVRRLTRRTGLTDDLDLLIALTHLDGSDFVGARRALERMARQAARTGAGAPNAEGGLTLADLRATPVSLAARLAELYASRPDRSEDLLRFLGRLFDRNAFADVPAALELVAAAEAGREV